MKHLNDILKESLLDSEETLMDNSDHAIAISRLSSRGYFIKTVEELYKKYNKTLSIKDTSTSSNRSYQIRKYDPSKHYFILVKPKRGKEHLESYCIICNDKNGIAVGLDNYKHTVRHRRWVGLDTDDYDSFEEVITTYYHRTLKVCEVLPEDEWLYEYITKKIDY